MLANYRLGVIIDFFITFNIIYDSRIISISLSHYFDMTHASCLYRSHIILILLSHHSRINLTSLSHHSRITPASSDLYYYYRRLSFLLYLSLIATIFGARPTYYCCHRLLLPLLLPLLQDIINYYYRHPIIVILFLIATHRYCFLYS